MNDRTPAGSGSPCERSSSCTEPGASCGRPCRPSFWQLEQIPSHAHFSCILIAILALRKRRSIVGRYETAQSDMLKSGRGETFRGGSNEHSTCRLSGAFFQCLDARVVLCPGYSVAALVCRGRRAHQYPLLPVAAHYSMAAGYLGARVHGHQSVSDPPHISGKAPSSPFRRRTEALRDGVWITAAARICLTFDGG